MTDRHSTRKSTSGTNGERAAAASKTPAKKTARLSLPDTNSRAYSTKGGAYYTGDSLELLQSKDFKPLQGKVQLLLTSPPYPLNEKKGYGNLTGNDLAPGKRTPC